MPFSAVEINDVISIREPGGIDSDTTVNSVVSKAAEDRVLSDLAVENIVPVAPNDVVVALSGIDIFDRDQAVYPITGDLPFVVVEVNAVLGF